MTSPPRSPRDEGSGGSTGSSSLPSDLGRHAGHGLTLAVATAVFAWLGTLADDRLGTEPLLVVVGAAVGFGAGFYSMYRSLVGRGSDGTSASDGARGAGSGADDDADRPREEA